MNLRWSFVETTKYTKTSLSVRPFVYFVYFVVLPDLAPSIPAQPDDLPRFHFDLKKTSVDGHRAGIAFECDAAHSRMGQQGARPASGVHRAFLSLNVRAQIHRRQFASFRIAKSDDPVWVIHN